MLLLVLLSDLLGLVLINFLMLLNLILVKLLLVVCVLKLPLGLVKVGLVLKKLVLVLIMLLLVLLMNLVGLISINMLMLLILMIMILVVLMCMACMLVLATLNMSLHHIPLLNTKIQGCPSIHQYIFLLWKSTLTPSSHLQAIQIPVLAYRTGQCVFTRLCFAQIRTSGSTICGCC
ncbi:hypothetical protein PDJAM_G00217250 [Pangasius djambal]|uniref:Uncharacterized protein n=1 Tax=Pangasius djambal TaxID=1691987 RepID=A0ACC5YAY9_9TELE|nr:hypothetical protein [Pangasius djambal]